MRDGVLWWTVQLARPRVRVEDRFESRLLPLCVRPTETVAELLPTLYLHGLSVGDYALALRGLLGDGTPPLTAPGTRE